MSPVIIVSPPPTVQAPICTNRKTSSRAMAARAMVGSRVLRKNSMMGASFCTNIRTALARGGIYCQHLSDNPAEPRRMTACRSTSKSPNVLGHMFNACTTEQISEFVPQKRGFRIHGHSTTIRLEAAFWHTLEDMVRDLHMDLPEIMRGHPRPLPGRERQEPRLVPARDLPEVCRGAPGEPDRGLRRGRQARGSPRPALPLQRAHQVSRGRWLTCT